MLQTICAQRGAERAVNLRRLMRYPQGTYLATARSRKYAVRSAW
jgi:hypothetical protein